MSKSIKSKMIFMVVALMLAITFFMIAISILNFEIVLTGGHDKLAKDALSSTMKIIEMKYSELISYEMDAIARRRELMKNIADTVLSTLDSYFELYQSGLLTQEEAQQRSLEWLSQIRFGQNRYFFVYDNNLTGLAHPLPEMIGKKWDGFTDFKFNDALTHIKNSIGETRNEFTVFQWKDIETGKLMDHMGYFCSFPKWNWIIGSGIPLKNIEKLYHEKTAYIREDIDYVLSRLQFNTIGHIFIFDSQGNIFLHPDIGKENLQQVHDHITGKSILDILKESYDSSQKKASYSIDSADGGTQKEIVFIDYFKSLDLYVAASIMENAIDAPLLNLGLRQTAIAILLLLLGIYITVFFSKKITRPVSMLTHWAKALPSRDLSQTNIESLIEIRKFNAPLEVEQLIDAFIFMESELRKNIGQIIEHQAFIQGIMENAPNGIITITENGVIESVNSEVETILGFSPEEMKGQCIDRFFDKKIKQEWDTHIKNRLDRAAISHPSGLIVETTGKSKKGNNIPVELRFSEMTLRQNRSIICVVIDITEWKSIENALKTHREQLKKQVETRTFELSRANDQLKKEIEDRKKTEKALRESEHFVNAITNSIPSILYIHDLIENRNIYANQKLTEILGYTSEEAAKLGEELLIKVIHPEDYHKINKMIEVIGTIGDGEVIDFEYRVKTVNNEWIWVSDHAVVFNRTPEGNPRQILGVLQDINHRKIMESELLKAKVEAEKANRAKSEFLANMSHEIRTPLGIITATTDMLRDLQPPNKIVKYLNVINEAAISLKTLVNQILDISKIEAGKFKIDPVLFDLHELLTNIHKAFQVNVMKKEIDLYFEIDPDVPQYLTGDPLKLSQIIQNLLSNAIKFTENGYIRLSVKPTKRSKTSVTLLFSVQDTGIGVPRDVLPHLFEKFFQSDSSYTKKYEGTGLGLTISKNIVELMEGRIWIESELGSGSTFFFEIPFEYDERQAKGFDHNGLFDKQDAANKASALPRLKILLAEDQELYQEYIKHFIRKAGHIVHSVTNGKEALDLLARESFDLVLMDIHMPEISGIEATKRIRNGSHFGQNADIPIIALTACAMEEEKEKMIQSGANAYITKPIDTDFFWEEVFRILSPKSENERARVPTSLMERHENYPYIEDIKKYLTKYRKETIFLKDILDGFMTEATVKLDNLDKAFHRKDSEQIAQAAHKMVSLTSVLQIRSTSDHARQMETAARQNDFETATSLYRTVTNEMGVILEYIKKVNIEEIIER